MQKREAQLGSVIAEDISKYFKPHLIKNDTDYLCVYGGSTYKDEETSRSDIDMFVVTHGEQIAIDGLITFISQLHEKHGRKADEEVPYENKVRYTSSEIDSAVTYGGFNVANGKITVPHIEKNQAFLSSPAVKARLALNALTTPHIAYGDDLRHYTAARTRAEDSVTLLATQLVEKKEFGIEDLYERLVVSSDGRTGEMFLGYKTDYPIVSEYLRNVLDASTDRLSRVDIIQRHNNTFSIPDDFDPHAYITSAQLVTK
jgi:predicted nucleotidyltransferase